MLLYLRHRRLKVPKTSKEIEVRVKMNIRPGSVTPHMRKCWKTWWTNRIAECQADLKAEEKAGESQ